jgi:hypothetical protein
MPNIFLFIQAYTTTFLYSLYPKKYTLLTNAFILSGLDRLEFHRYGASCYLNDGGGKRLGWALANVLLIHRRADSKYLHQISHNRNRNMI